MPVVAIKNIDFFFLENVKSRFLSFLLNFLSILGSETEF
jgi:hypothetical protein